MNTTVFLFPITRLSIRRGSHEPDHLYRGRDRHRHRHSFIPRHALNEEYRFSVGVSARRLGTSTPVLVSFFLGMARSQSTRDIVSVGSALPQTARQASVRRAACRCCSIPTAWAAVSWSRALAAASGFCQGTLQRCSDFTGYAKVLFSYS